MIAFLAAAMLAPTPASARSMLVLCRPALARKADGDIAQISVDQSVARGRSTTIRGRMTVFVGMGPPPAGSASAHHLIRAEYAYLCEVSGGKVRKTILSQ